VAYIVHEDEFRVIAEPFSDGDAAHEIRRRRSAFVRSPLSRSYEP